MDPVTVTRLIKELELSVGIRQMIAVGLHFEMATLKMQCLK